MATVINLPADTRSYEAGSGLGQGLAMAFQKQFEQKLKIQQVQRAAGIYDGVNKSASREEAYSVIAQGTKDGVLDLQDLRAAYTMADNRFPREEATEKVTLYSTDTRQPGEFVVPKKVAGELNTPEGIERVLGRRDLSNVKPEKLIQFLNPETLESKMAPEDKPPEGFMTKEAAHLMIQEKAGIRADAASKRADIRLTKMIEAQGEKNSPEIIRIARARLANQGVEEPNQKQLDRAVTVETDVRRGTTILATRLGGKLEGDGFIFADVTAGQKFDDAVVLIRDKIETGMPYEKAVAAVLKVVTPEPKATPVKKDLEPSGEGGMTDIGKRLKAAFTNEPKGPSMSGKIRQAGEVNLPPDIVKQLKKGFKLTLSDGSEWTLDEQGKPKQLKAANAKP